MRIFQKPKLENKELLKSIQDEIFSYTKKLEDLKKNHEEESKRLEEIHSNFLAQKRADLYDLENLLVTKRQERAYLEKPLTEKQSILNVRESALNFKEDALKDKEQEILKREIETESKLDALRNLSTELSEKNLTASDRINKIFQKESILTQRENDYFLKVEALNSISLAKSNELEEREKILELKELNVQSKEENIAQREKQLIQDKLLVQSQRQALLMAKNATTYNQHSKK